MNCMYLWFLGQRTEQQVGDKPEIDEVGDKNDQDQDKDRSVKS